MKMTIKIDDAFIEGQFSLHLENDYGLAYGSYPPTLSELINRIEQAVNETWHYDAGYKAGLKAASEPEQPGDAAATDADTAKHLRDGLRRGIERAAETEQAAKESNGEQT